MIMPYAPLKILLDFDGVMVTTPTWRPVAQLDDGFMAFNELCAQNLAEMMVFIEEKLVTADIVLTTTHRIHYDNDKWRVLLANRAIITEQVSKVNDAQTIEALGVRYVEIMAWVDANPDIPYIIIDDDKSLRHLPNSIKRNWVETSFYSGFNKQAKSEALAIIQTHL